MTDEANLLLVQLQIGKEVLETLYELETDETLAKQIIKLGVFDNEPDDNWKITIERNE